MENIYSDLDSENPVVQLNSSVWIPRILELSGKLARQYLFISLTQPTLTQDNSFTDKIGFDLSVLINLEDLSLLIKNGLQFYPVENLLSELSIYWTLGDEYSEFMNNMSNFAALLKFEIYF